MTVRISAGEAPRSRWLKELVDYHELVYFLLWRDLKVRYKQTAFGAAWAVLQPLSLMLVFTVFLGKIVRVPSDGIPYPVFVYSALVPWTLFTQSFLAASNSLVDSANLISKVYFPRIALPLASSATFLLDFALSLLVLFGLMAGYGIRPGWPCLLLPLLALWAYVTALAVGTFFSAVNVRYRDVRYALPFLTQVWMFLSPIVYPSSLVPSQWRALYFLNPVAGIAESFRWALLSAPAPPLRSMIASLLGTLVTLALAVRYFQSHERSFADTI